MLLATLAVVLIIAFQASPTRLIQLYIVGVFVSFVCRQTGMIRHWNRLLRTERDQGNRRRMQRSRVINTIGAAFTAIVLIIVLTTQFTRGAYIGVIAMPIIWLTMRSVHRHYENVRLELAADADEPVTLPSRNIAVVLAARSTSPGCELSPTHGPPARAGSRR